MILDGSECRQNLRRLKFEIKNFFFFIFLEASNPVPDHPSPAAEAHRFTVISARVPLARAHDRSATNRSSPQTSPHASILSVLIL